VTISIKSLNIGDTLQIAHLNQDVISRYYAVRLIGGVDHKSLICTLPEVDGKVMYVLEHTGFVVKFFSGKTVYQFNTIASAVYSRPYPHMHLLFPTQVRRQQLRKNQRVAVDLIVSLSNLKESGSIKLSGRLTDLSLGGALVETAHANWMVDDELVVTFKVHHEHQEDVIQLRGQVRKIKEMEARLAFKRDQIGIQFMQMSTAQHLVLQSYIFRLITGESLATL